MLDFESSFLVADQTPEGFITNNCTGSFAVIDGTFRRRRDAPAMGNDRSSFRLGEVRRVLVLKNGEKELCWSLPGKKQ